MSAAIATACSTAVSSMTSVTNAAGFAGCYDILEWDAATTMFQADLRLYQQSPATGDFANVSASQITVMLTFPDSTQFKPLSKRSTTDIIRRDGIVTQIQQLSLTGTLKQPFDASKLNLTFLASLMVPQISLQAKQPSSPSNMITTNMTATDSAWFVIGQFTNISAQFADVANPATAAAATIAGRGFQLPGTTLGIFPTGLIITSIWTLMFVTAFGLGTIGRIKSRKIYRSRITNLASRGRI